MQVLIYQVLFDDGVTPTRWTVTFDLTNITSDAKREQIDQLASLCMFGISNYYTELKIAGGVLAS